MDTGGQTNTTRRREREASLVCSFRDHTPSTLQGVGVIKPNCGQRSCWRLIVPGRVAQRLPIEFLAVVTPQRHEMIQIRDEAVIMMTFEQVYHFMDNDVL